MFKEIKNEKAFDGILNQIIENIQNGHLKAGDALPAERTMAETMGVSRPAVREVLRALELLGIIKTVPGGGNYIADDLDSWLIGPLSILFKLNNGYIRQTQQLRAALEREMAILAARKCTPLDAAEVKEMVHIAHEEGLAVMSHTNGNYGVQAALSAGVRNLLGDGRYEDDALKPIVESAEENIRKAFQLGVKVALGSDAGAYRVIHGKGIQDEVQAFVQILGDREAVYRWLADGESEIRKRFIR